MVQTLLNFGQGCSDAGALIRKPDADRGLAPQPDTSQMEDVQPTQPHTADELEEEFATQSSGVSADSLTLRLNRRKELRHIARQTVNLLPQILELTPHAPPKGYLYTDPPILRRNYCPRLPPTKIRVLDADTLDTAIGLAECAKYIDVVDKQPVCILNMANAYNAGGGWKNGALAQEEAICYRSSLSFTLKLRFYPLPETSAIYSPTVVVIRRSLKDGHHLMPLDEPGELPIVSAVSVAAKCRPRVMVDTSSPGAGMLQKEVYVNPQDRKLMKEKIRVVLRSAAVNRHRRLVLGALGCGAFANPREEVAECFAEVFKEHEFSGGWWESIIFAVMDDLGEGKSGDGNYGVFYRRLHGISV